MREQNTILIAEDDRLINEGIYTFLSREGYSCITARSGRECLEKAGRGTDLLLLDVNLPDCNGYTLCREIKDRYEIPVIFITVKDEEQNILRGFDCGCDDYITKPFSMNILLRRIDALLKRTGRKNSAVYLIDDIQFDLSERSLEIKGQPVALTHTEVRILCMLIENRNHILPREKLLEKIWDEKENYVDEKTLNVHISRLRNKIARFSGSGDYIKTIFGIGYKWNEK